MEADELAKLAARQEAIPQDVFFQTITEPSIKAALQDPKQIHAVTSKDWRTQIITYLKGLYELDTESEAKRMQQRARNYRIIEGQLHKSGICCSTNQVCKQNGRHSATQQSAIWNLRSAYWTSGASYKSS